MMMSEKKKLGTFCKLEERYQNLEAWLLEEQRLREMQGRLWCRRLVVQLSSATFCFFSKVSKNREKRLISDDTSASSSVAQGVGGFTVNQDVEGSTLTRNQSFLQVQQPKSKPPTARRNGSSVAASGWGGAVCSSRLSAKTVCGSNPTCDPVTSTAQWQGELKAMLK